MQRQTFYYQGQKPYEVRARALAGRVLIKEASHPTSVTVNVEFPWLVVGHVEEAPVRNPGVAYAYVDGPADSVVLVRQDGTEAPVPKGRCMVVYFHADKPACTDVDSRGVFKGAKFPAEGTYTIWLLSGYLSEDEAVMGRWSLAGFKELVTGNVRGFAGFPVMAYALGGRELLSVFGPMALGSLVLMVSRR